VSLHHKYYSLSKKASINPWLLTAGIGGTLGGLYGIGDSGTNYYNDPSHSSTIPRAGQGALTAIGGFGGYKLGRGLKAGRLGSGLIGLLSAAGAHALTNPSIKKDTFMGLPY
jgi:hypothetical protein